ncbi:uncharacterized protein LOC144666273 [Oculina patagonica]
MEDAKPVLAGKGGQRLKKLQASVKTLEETLTCKPCSTIDEYAKRLNKIEAEIAALKQPACIFDFEDGIAGWEKTGTAFDNQPTYGDNPTARNRGQPAKQQGDWWIGGYENRPSQDGTPGAVQGDGPKGTLTSPPFTIMGKYIAFLIGGGCDANLVRAELIVDGNVVKTVTGKCTETMHRETWDVIEYYGQRAQVRLVDNSSAGWAHINFDDMKGDIICGQN